MVGDKGSSLRAGGVGMGGIGHPLGQLARVLVRRTDAELALPSPPPPAVGSPGTAETTRTSDTTLTHAAKRKRWKRCKAAAAAA
jgi:hypothetical protein